MSKSKNKYYVVWTGRNPGIYSDWETCQKEIMGCKGAKYKSFPDRLSAETAFRQGPDAYWGKDVVPMVDLSAASVQPVSPAIAVDAACAGNPGKMEYQGVFVDFSTQPATRKNLFKSAVFPNATNNIGEFLAIVHGLALLKQMNSPIPIYTDSITALAWVRHKKHKSIVLPTEENERIFDLLNRAELWLHNNTYTTKIIKWDTRSWGEIPADFGRK